MKLRKLLLVTDGSEESVKADDLAITLGTLAGAEVVVMCSFQSLAGARRRASAGLEELRRAIEEDATEVLQEVAGRIREAGLEVRAMAVEGSPSETIQQVVEEEQPDMVILGTGRTSGLPGLLWGSVAEIIRTATVPITVVK